METDPLVHLAQCWLFFLLCCMQSFQQEIITGVQWNVWLCAWKTGAKPLSYGPISNSMGGWGGGSAVWSTKRGSRKFGIHGPQNIRHYGKNSVAIQPRPDHLPPHQESRQSRQGKASHAMPQWPRLIPAAQEQSQDGLLHEGGVRTETGAKRVSSRSRGQEGASDLSPVCLEGREKGRRPNRRKQACLPWSITLATPWPGNGPAWLSTQELSCSR